MTCINMTINKQINKQENRDRERGRGKEREIMAITDNGKTQNQSKCTKLKEMK